MADLKPLIRFRKHLVDEKQKMLSQLYRDAEKIEQSKQAIIDQMDKESALAAEMGSTEAHQFLGRYLEGARKKIKALDASLKKMEVRIAAAQEDIRNAFAEMKKVEIIQTRREDEEERVEDKKESDALDDMGIERFNKDKIQ
jgi:flagellar export protein FliJ